MVLEKETPSGRPAAGARLGDGAIAPFYRSRGEARAWGASGHPRGRARGGGPGAVGTERSERAPPRAGRARLLPACPPPGEARGAEPRGAEPRASRVSSRRLLAAALHRCSPAGPPGLRFRAPGLVPEGAGTRRPGAVTTWQRLSEHLADAEHGWRRGWPGRALRLGAPTVCQARCGRCLLPSSPRPMQERRERIASCCRRGTSPGELRLLFQAQRAGFEPSLEGWESLDVWEREGCVRQGNSLGKGVEVGRLQGDEGRRGQVGGPRTLHSVCQRLGGGLAGHSAAARRLAGEILRLVGRSWEEH